MLRGSDWKLSNVSSGRVRRPASIWRIQATRSAMTLARSWDGVMSLVRPGSAASALAHNGPGPRHAVGYTVHPPPDGQGRHSTATPPGLHPAPGTDRPPAARPGPLALPPGGPPAQRITVRGLARTGVGPAQAGRRCA